LFRIHPSERLAYKHQYEHFKLDMTIVTLVIILLNLFVVDALWLDKVHQFVMMYFYATTTVREHVLWVNGSRIRTWWFLHHYLSIAITGVLLVWPVDRIYLQFRHQFLYFSLYIGTVLHSFDFIGLVTAKIRLSPMFL
jgi:hypothetical protein